MIRLDVDDGYSEPGRPFGLFEMGFIKTRLLKLECMDNENDPCALNRLSRLEALLHSGAG